MISKSKFKTINNVLGWITRIVLLYYLSTHRFSSEGFNFIILWSLFGLSSLSIVIDEKFFKNNFTLKKNKMHIFTIIVSIVCIIIELISPLKSLIL